MKLNILSIFKNKPKIKGIISQYHLEDWWSESFDDKEKEEIIIALVKAPSFGVGVSNNQLTTKKNNFTDSDSITLTATPFVDLYKPLTQINPNNYLYFKYIEAIESLIPRYFHSDFNLNDEIENVIPIDYQSHIKECYANGTNNIYTSIEFFYLGIISNTYLLKKDKFFFDKCLMYCEKYMVHIDLYFNARKSVRESLHKLSKRKIDIEVENSNLSSSSLDRYIMLLQHLGNYNKALNTIEYLESIGWRNDWTKRKSILLSKLKKIS